MKMYMEHCDCNTGPISPRAHQGLFTLLRPKGLKVVPIVELSAEFKNPFLKKIRAEVFSQFELKVGYLLMRYQKI